MAFTAALHTYYRVSDIPHAKVTGLEGVAYLDSLAAQGSQEAVQQLPQISFDQEVDRIYLATPDTIQVRLGQPSPEGSTLAATRRRCMQPCSAVVR
jgi:glucose-6-phosphate 1-epimerase